jgi:hypothetical protein
MLGAQKRMEEALAQQTILDLARRFGRKAPAAFGQRVNEWMGSGGTGRGVVAGIYRWWLFKLF